MLTSLELCAGAGGTALGLEAAGFHPLALVELDPASCATLRANRPAWNVLEKDIRTFSAHSFRGVDLLSAGVPCPPFSVAGKQLGADDERDLFPEALRLVSECQPRAVMIENVRGLLSPTFRRYREQISQKLESLGYVVRWRLLNASDFGVSQLRPRLVLVGIARDFAEGFAWPEPCLESAPTVGQLLFDEMVSRGWRGAAAWSRRANSIAPTLVGGSKLHGGPDLGPTRARRAWAELGVDGRGLANEPPVPDFFGMPRLTLQMAALVQGFPRDWEFSGGKTRAYRQIGNAFPPPVPEAVATSIRRALLGSAKKLVSLPSRTSRTEPQAALFA
ncbi:MAG TPA: DNA (cytosine-5-)-methyltransferase [Actinobacteria bacterium]|nr:DNA (cytosine-5-)-methyltransferase [Actinomycetota bacterium]